MTGSGNRATGSRLLLQILDQLGVRVVFTVPGNHSLGVLDALDQSGMPRGIVARQEQTAALMADGYAAAGGGVAAVLSCGGPGALNTMTACHVAHRDGRAFLNLITAPDNALRAWRLGLVHELPEQLSAFRDVTKAQLRPRWTGDLLHVLPAAMTTMSAAPAAPVVVELPQDVLEGVVDVGLPPAGDVRAVGQARLQCSDASLQHIRTAVDKAERPLLIAGRGARELAEGALLADLAERLDAPVLTTLAGRGAIDERHPMAMGASLDLPLVKALVQRSDCLVVLGSSLGAGETGKFTLQLPPQTLQIDADRGAIGRSYPYVHPVHADCVAVVRQLLASLKRSEGSSRHAWRGELLAAKGAEHERLRRLEPGLVKVLERVREGVPAGTVLVNDVTTAAYWGWHFWPVARPEEYVYPTHSVALGYGLPAAIGATFATDKPVLLLTGDGGLGYGLSDLSTAAKYRRNLHVVVVNDSGFGLFRHRGVQRYGRARLVDLSHTNYAEVAVAHGVSGRRVALEKLPEVLEASFARGGPSLFEVVGDFQPPFDT